MTNSIGATTVIYGVELGQHLVAKKSEMYLLQLGAFKTRSSAQAQQKKFTVFTHTALQIVVPKIQGELYKLVYGPTLNTAAIRKLSQQILEHQARPVPSRRPSPISKSSIARTVNLSTPQHDTASVLHAQAIQYYLQSIALKEQISNASSEAQKEKFNKKLSRIQDQLDALEKIAIQRVTKFE